MSIHGTLKTMSVSDLLQFLAASNKTGTLKITRAGIIKQIYFEEGSIVGSNSNEPTEFLGQVLLHYGKISEEQLRTAMEKHRASGERLGIILSSSGVVEQDHIMEVLRTRTMEIIYDLFIWKEANFEFFDNQPLPDHLIRIHVDPTSVIMEGIYRIDEWSRYRQRIPSDRTFFLLNSGWTQTLHESKETREVLYHVEKRMTAAEISYNMHTSLFHASALLFTLLEREVITVAGEAPELPTDLSALKLPQTVPELLKLARSELNESNVENALAIINGALEQEPQSIDANRLREDAEQKFIAQVYREIPAESVPKLLESLEQLEHERLGPQEGFVLSRINSETDVASIVSVCPFREVDSLRMIKKLKDGGIIGI